MYIQKCQEIMKLNRNYIEILNYTQDVLVLNCKLNRSKDAFVL